ncbi:uncharacterized protein LOC123316241 isoform X2 [Coccinella septempunctata]|uniref:uncharacterized protein LOC123316241 isoform X2 n=1 Tax=Coccinella septempunctata TaxID=41139 RepID=UPI001D0659E9|nr:uncharacterized protein LOC123316241 isoform X2 [Coccinella septempunctata]
MKVLYFLLIFLLAYAAATQALPSHQTSDGADMDGTVESVDEVRAKRGFDDRESSSLRDKRDLTISDILQPPDMYLMFNYGLDLVFKLFGITPYQMILLLRMATKLLAVWDSFSNSYHLVLARMNNFIDFHYNSVEDVN